jgi:hypothetical protein
MILKHETNATAAEPGERFFIERVRIFASEANDA